MKLSALLLSVLFSVPALATSRAPLVCNNMVNNEIQDNFVQVSLLNGAVDFQIYENSISASAKETIVSGNTVAVINKKLKGSVEGDDYTAVANALVVLDASRKKLLVTLILDGRALIQEELNCKM